MAAAAEGPSRRRVAGRRLQKAQQGRIRLDAPLARMAIKRTIHPIVPFALEPRSIVACGRKTGSSTADGVKTLYGISQENRDMAKGKKKVETVFLVCDETGDYNYTLRRKSGGEKLKLQKYSSRLRRRTLHTEKKK